MAHYLPEEKSDLEKIINREANSPAINQLKKKQKKKVSLKLLTGIIAVFIFAALLSSGYILYKASSAFDKVTGRQNSVLESVIRMLPFGNNFFEILPVEGENSSTIEKLRNNELNRLNILLLGIRGASDPNGGLLTDTIMIVSAKPQTGEVALISIPRDLYVDMPYSGYKNKINEAYALGVKKGGWKDGLKYSKKAVSDVTGLNIHYAASVDFEAFREVIDILGGATITLDKPFSEKNQFEEGSIELPAGKQTIDGKTALLFVRARFSTSDFDRAKRQQQILVAVKEKAFGLGALSNPFKVISILNSIGNHLRTNAELWEMQELAVLSGRINSSNIKRKVFNTSQEGLLYDSRDANGSYILLPEGESFDKIREACRNIFE